MIKETRGSQKFTFDPSKEKIIRDPEDNSRFTLIELTSIEKTITRIVGGEKFTFNPDTHVLVWDPLNPGKAIIQEKVKDPGPFPPPNSIFA